MNDTEVMDKNTDKWKKITIRNRHNEKLPLLMGFRKRQFMYGAGFFSRQ